MKILQLSFSMFFLLGCLGVDSYPEIIISRGLERQYDTAKFEFYRFNGSGICDCKGVYVHDNGIIDTTLLIDVGISFIGIEMNGDTLEYMFESTRKGVTVKSLVEQHLAPCSSLLKIAFKKGEKKPIFIDMDRVRFQFGENKDERRVIEIGEKKFLFCVKNNPNINSWLKKYLKNNPLH